ncbi:MAG: ABC transporter permease [Blastocatellia bacterium]|nr:ABC transporter permease [Blastocatellia bacterium]
MQTLMQDLRYGARMLLKKPGFTFIAVLTLALGIGANTAIFSVVNAVLLDPFPYPEQTRLVQIHQHRPQVGVSEQPLHAGPEFLAYREQAGSFEQMAAVETVSRNITIGGQEPERVFGAKVSADFFTMLGVPPLVGRALLPDEQGAGGRRSVVIGYGLWQRRTGCDPGVIDLVIELDGESYTVVGVMPQRFGHRDTEFWFPFPFDLSEPPRSQRWYAVLARLKPGVSLRQANAELETIARRIEQDHAAGHAEYENWNVSALLLRDALLGSVRPAVLILFAAVGVVLLIACANVASLLLARASARQPEVAIRAALGASRGRLLRQFLTESALLALLGGGLGLLLGAWGVDGLRALIPTGNLVSGSIPAEAVIGVSPPVLLFTAAIALATVFLFGLWPALQAAQVEIGPVLHEAGRSGTGSVALRRARSVLVVTEIALALMLLISAGLLLRSFIGLMNVDLGFNAENTLTMRFNLPPGKYRTPGEKATFYRQLIEQVRTLPGVKEVAVASHPPFWFTERWNFALEGQTAPEQRQSADYRVISPDYYRLMSMPLLKGRGFTEQDREGQPLVTIINETMARRFWGDADPVGQRFLLYIGNAGPFPATIIGVAGDARQIAPDQPVEPEMNFPLAQAAGAFRRMNLFVRTAVEPTTLVEAIRRQVWQLDKQLPMYSISTMREAVNSSVGSERFALWLLALFACVALLLALIGIYGVMGYTVAQRTREIGIRLALGATPRDIRRLVIGQGIRLALIGVACGLAGAFALTRLMDGLLFGVSATDPLTFAGVAALLVIIALLACYIPARRAARVDPGVALRYE